MRARVMATFILRKSFKKPICPSSLQHQAHTLETAAVLGAGGADVDTGGVDAAVAQQIGQLGQVLVQPVERAGEQVAEVVGKHFFVGDAGGAAQGLHLAPDVAAVQGMHLQICWEM